MNENTYEGVSPFRIAFCIILTLIIFAGFILRLFNWQIVNGDEYVKTVIKTSKYTVETSAIRGEILDRNGNEFSINVTGYKVIIDKLYMQEKTENEIIEKLIDLMATKKEKWVDILPITIDKNGVYQFIKNKDDEVATLKGKNILNLNSYATAEDCMTWLVERYDINGEYTKEKLRSIISVRYNMEKCGFNMTTTYTFAEGISADMVAIISENFQNTPGVRVETTAIRTMLNSTLMPHIVGYVGALSQEEYEENKDKGYKLNDKIGKIGIESGMENLLRGETGIKEVERSETGEIISEKIIRQAKPGNTVFLTIDSKLQKLVNKSLANAVKSAREEGKALAAGSTDTVKKFGQDCTSGAVVVMNVKDFSILAASTYPSYDLNKYLDDYDYYVKINQNKAAPLYNKAFNGAYNPGSIFKPCVAAAALEEGTIATDTYIYCSKYYNYYKNYTLECMGWHGSINMNTAISSSCNYFFAEVGRLLGIKTLNLYAERFGLGEKTGIEASETRGILAYRDSVEWYDGNTSQAAIGQSDNAFSPLQLATYVSTIANGGNRYQAHIVKKVVDYSRKETILKNTAKNNTLISTCGVSKTNLYYVQEAMKSVANVGTASSIFGDYGIQIAAKTGTAENSGSDHVTFIGYAPYDNPEIAIAVVLEHGAKGKYSMGIAKDVFDYYFKDELAKLDKQNAPR